MGVLSFIALKNKSLNCKKVNLHTHGCVSFLYISVIWRAHVSPTNIHFNAELNRSTTT